MDGADRQRQAFELGDKMNWYIFNCTGCVVTSKKI